MITLKTYAGLANRMRAIDSALQISKSQDHQLKVIWEMSWELNCSFFSLFKPVDQFTLEEFSISRYPMKFRNLFYRVSDRIGIPLPLKYSKHVLNRDIEDAMEKKDTENLFPKNKDIYLSTVHQFKQAEDSFSYFCPIDELQEKIEQLKSQYSENTIGIHIRRTDNAVSIQSSPREAFVNQMKDEIAQNPDTRFFLATDSEEEEAFLRDQFPDRIITHSKELSRNSEKGIQDALIDLYALSNTKKIIGSFYSSFSEVSAQIRNIPLELINIKN